VKYQPGGSQPGSNGIWRSRQWRHGLQCEAACCGGEGIGKYLQKAENLRKYL